MMEKHPLHLKNPELQKSPEVNAAVKRQERVTSERVPNDPAERIEAYMGRLERVFLYQDKDNPGRAVEKRERALDGHLFGAKESLREKIHAALIIKKENFPESYFELQQRVARERGQAVEEIPDAVREQMMDVAIQDQRASLDAWIDYLSSGDAVYPPWFKYYAFTQVTKLSQFDKERGEFKKRTDSTVAPFPDIYREPLAQIADLYEKIKTNNKSLKEPEVKSAFSKKFPALYAELIQKSLEATVLNKEEIRGAWVKYEQGREGDAEKLYQSLENRKTGWCTAGRGTAEQQMENGDFYVYYTNDENGIPVQPRLAIRMEGKERLAEVRGILPQQNVEPVMQEVLDKKLNEFGSEADAYKKKSADMKVLTIIEKKTMNGDPLTKDDLLLLYEVNGSIQGFGYEKDPRIKELRSQRNLDEDMLVIFECTKDQIAHVPSEIKETTKAYVGQLEPGIFDVIAKHGIEHVYTSFPEGKIRREMIEIGGMDVQHLKAAITSEGMKIEPYAESMMDHKDFTTGKTKENADLVRLSVADLGFKNGATTDKIFHRAKELGLELCPPEVGPRYRLHYKDQPMDEWVRIAMEPITDSGGSPIVFNVGRYADGVWLSDDWANPTNEWNPDSPFLFRLRKSEPEELEY